MRTLILSAAMACILAFAVSHLRAADTDKDKAQPAVTGVLIDQMCGGKMIKEDDPEKAAGAHEKSCCMKDSCAKSGYAVISGKEMIKFDDNGNKLAKEFLDKTDKTDHLRVSVEGTRDGDSMKVTSIKAAPAAD